MGMVIVEGKGAVWGFGVSHCNQWV